MKIILVFASQGIVRFIIDKALSFNITNDMQKYLTDDSIVIMSSR